MNADCRLGAEAYRAHAGVELSRRGVEVTALCSFARDEAETPRRYTRRINNCEPPRRRRTRPKVNFSFGVSSPVIAGRNVNNDGQRDGRYVSNELSSRPGCIILAFPRRQGSSKRAASPCTACPSSGAFTPHIYDRAPGSAGD